MNPLRLRRQPRLQMLESRTVPATFTVLNTADSGVGSLRDAIAQANNTVASDIVEFSAKVFAKHQTITLTTGQIAITEDLTITGPSAGVTISGNMANRVFEIKNGIFMIGTSVVMTGLTITKGVVAGPGGGIRNNAQSLSMTDCTITANSATGSFSGGGISSPGGGSVALTRCSLTSNTASGNGGGIDANTGASVTLTDCSVTTNTAANQGGGLGIGSSSLKLERTTVSSNSAKNGGGLYFAGTVGGGGLTILECTLASNTASVGGGGLSLSNFVGSLVIQNSTLAANAGKGGNGGAINFAGGAGANTLILQNSTLSGNSATSTGGGVALSNFGGPMTVQNSTITLNKANSGGGGILRSSGLGTISIESSVVSDNTAPSGAEVFTTGKASAKTSAFNTTSGISVFDDLGGNLIGTSLFLGPLQNNGGRTLTHLPATSSPLVNAGSNPAGLANDQRGSGFPRVRGIAADIGSAEPEELPPLIVVNNNDGGAGSLRQMIDLANANFGPDTITFDPGVFGVPRTILLTIGEMLVSDSVTIVGPGAGLTTITSELKSRLLSIKSAASDVAVTISGLTMSQFQAAGDGGAILIDNEALTINNCVFSFNHADGDGGAIAIANGGALKVEASTFVNNDTTISNNGGAIAFQNGGQLLIENSTLAFNIARVDGVEGGVGGGIYFFGDASKGGFTIINSTISDNESGICSGGIGLANFQGAAIIENTTVAANKTGNGGGGGIELVGSTGSMDLRSSVVGGNMDSFGSSDIQSLSVMLTLLNCAVGNETGFTFNGTNMPMAFADMKLGNLALNGGSTMTRALLAGSPLIDVGSNISNQTTDQRGPGFPRVSGKAADIGAFEFQYPPRVQSVVVNGGAAQRSRVTSVQVTFDSPVTLPANPADAFQLTKQGAMGSVQLAASVNANSVTLTFSGAGTEFGSLADGRYTLTAFAALINAGNFDGNGDGTSGDDYVLAGSPANGLFRLFGDADGNGTVNTADFAAFRLAFGGMSTIFDFNGNNSVDTADFAAFRIRFGSSI